ncbi:MAG: VOC family protein [Fimbriimonadaceae bacterium]
MSRRVGLVRESGLACRNLKEARQFYGGLLGLEIVHDGYDFVTYSADDLYLTLVAGENKCPGKVTYLTATDELTIVQSRLEASGVVFGGPAELLAKNYRGLDVYITFFTDPSGNRLAFMSKVPSENPSSGVLPF